MLLNLLPKSVGRLPDIGVRGSPEQGLTGPQENRCVCTKASKQVADGSSPPQCSLKCLKHRSIAEWLKQALHRTLFEQLGAHSLISAGGDEDNRNLLPAKLQFLLKLRSGHARHGDIKDQAFGPVDAIGGKELFRRRERPGYIAELL